MQPALGVPREPQTSAPGGCRRLLSSIRGSEWVIAAFLCWTAIAGALWGSPPVRNLILLWNLLVLICYSVAIYAELHGRAKWAGSVRDWLPFPILMLAYREMGWRAMPHDAYPLETSWVFWDRIVLRGGAKAVIESLGPVVPSILEISYTLVYSLGPFAVAMLYAYGRRDRAERFLFLFVASVLVCYAQYPFWPSEPPRTVFPNEDLPAYLTVFRRINLRMLGNYGIHTSVFPSGHVAAAFAAAFGAWRALPERRWLFRFLLVMAVLIATSTVYGRYHYLADALAGLTAAVCMLGFSIWKWRGSRA